jgi:hypothetical protein
MEPVTSSAIKLLGAGNTVDWLTQRKAVASEPWLPLHHQTPPAVSPSSKTVPATKREKKRSLCRI